MSRRLVFLFPALFSALPGHADPLVIEDGAADIAPQPVPEVIEVRSLRVREGQRLIVDLRAALEALGWAVEWAPAQQAILARQGQTRLVVKVNSAVAQINTRQVRLPGPARMLWDRVYVPVALLAELMRARVEYLGDAVRLTPTEGPALIIHLLG